MAITMEDFGARKIDQINFKRQQFLGKSIPSIGFQAPSNSRSRVLHACRFDPEVCAVEPEECILHKEFGD